MLKKKKNQKTCQIKEKKTEIRRALVKCIRHSKALGKVYYECSQQRIQKQEESSAGGSLSFGRAQRRRRFQTGAPRSSFAGTGSYGPSALAAGCCTPRKPKWKSQSDKLRRESSCRCRAEGFGGRRRRGREAGRRWWRAR